MVISLCDAWDVRIFNGVVTVYLDNPGTILDARKAYARWASLKRLPDYRRFWGWPTTGHAVYKRENEYDKRIFAMTDC